MPSAFDKLKLFVSFCDRWRWVDPRFGNRKIKCLPLVFLFTADSEYPVVPHFSGSTGPKKSTVWSEHFLWLPKSDGTDFGIVYSQNQVSRAPEHWLW